MKRHRVLFVAACAVTLGVCPVRATEKADLAIVNAHVWTVDDAMTEAEAA